MSWPGLLDPATHLAKRIFGGVGVRGHGALLQLGHNIRLLTPPSCVLASVRAGKLREFVLAMNSGEDLAVADECRILDTIGRMPPSKSLTTLHMPFTDVRYAVSALTGPQATHVLQRLNADCTNADVSDDEGPAASPWTFITIPTLRSLDIDGYPNQIVNPTQLDVLQDSLRSRERAGRPPLRALVLGWCFSNWHAGAYDFWENAEDYREFAQLLQRMRAVVESESPTTRFSTNESSLDDLIESGECDGASGRECACSPRGLIPVTRW